MKDEVVQEFFPDKDGYGNHSPLFYIEEYDGESSKVSVESCQYCYALVLSSDKDLHAMFHVKEG